MSAHLILAGLRGHDGVAGPRLPGGIPATTMAGPRRLHRPRPPCRLSRPPSPLPFSLPLRAHPPTAFSASSPARAEALLPRAVARGVVFVPGAPFFAGAAQANTLRPSFVTATLEEIERGCVALGRTFAEAITG